MTGILLAIASSIVLCGPVDAQVRATRPAILFEYHGANRGDGGVVFSVSVYEAGSVVFAGIRNTATSGEAQIEVERARVQEWLSALIKNGALVREERPTDIPTPDSDWYRLTVATTEATNSFRSHGWNRTHPLIQAMDAMLKEIELEKRWVSR